MVVGAGRGPLVRAVLSAAKFVSRRVKVYAVEKNPNAALTLQVGGSVDRSVKSRNSNRSPLLSNLSHVTRCIRPILFVLRHTDLKTRNLD